MATIQALEAIKKALVPKIEISAFDTVGDEIRGTASYVIRGYPTISGGLIPDVIVLSVPFRAHLDGRLINFKE